MAYDEGLARRLRDLLASQPELSERRMFGGVCFMLAGRMCCGVIGTNLVVRIGGEAYDAAAREPHVRPMDFTGRPLRGFLYVAPPGCRTDRALSRWLDRAVELVNALPVRTQPKRPRRPRPRASAR